MNHEKTSFIAYEGIDGLIKNLPQIVQSISDQLSPLAILCSVCIAPVENDEDLNVRIALTDELYSYAENTEHAAAKFADLITDLVYEYEIQNRQVPNVLPR
ncbi:hypothetical protein [Xenorhabdus lircayensis]|uniref:Phage protein n=1 Tax=Xenorhabdus lircayensis TaxID=2763499 RepID=A0ABS0U9R2_9GAMM|nr:hypothetical protein [Xenorhabdus lircayensis]MBI6549465.1 hypothetical protein [Xenorhabdus lircayensis]